MMISITRENLFRQVWETASMHLAKEFGISDSALSKCCRKYDIPKPPPGYWAKLELGAESRPNVQLPKSKWAADYVITFGRRRRSRLCPSDVFDKNSWPGKESWLPETVALAEEISKTSKHWDRRIRIRNARFPEITATRKQAERVPAVWDWIVRKMAGEGIEVLRGSRDPEPCRFALNGESIGLSFDEFNYVSRTLPKIPRGCLTISLNRHPVERWTESQSLSLLAAGEAAADALRRRLHAAIKERELEQIRMEEAAARAREEEARRHREMLARNFETAVLHWRRHKDCMAFISECEDRWRTESGGEISAAQRGWSDWATALALKLSPFTRGYPDPAKDGD